MTTEFVTGIMKGEDSFEVGKEAARKAISKLGKKEENLLTIVFASSKYNLKEVMKGVKAVVGKTVLIGSSSFGEFTEEAVMSESVACACLSTDSYKFFSTLNKGLKEDPFKCLEDAVKKLPSTEAGISGFPHLSAIVLPDGLTGRGEDVVDATNLAFGGDVKLAGGLAGEYNAAFKSTLVGTENEVESNAISLGLIASKLPVSIAVKHGHSPLSRPFMVTKASGGRLYELDGRNAWEVWKEEGGSKCKKILGFDIDSTKDPLEIEAFLAFFSMGIPYGSEYKIRSALGVNPDGSINFTTSIPEGCIMRIMSTTKDSLIESAKLAAESALGGMKGEEIAGAVVFDCGIRAMTLGKDFSKAIDGLKSTLKGIPIMGFETYGEIAMEFGQLSGFHNTTTVVLLLPK